MWRRLTDPVDEERRAALPILIAARWLLVVVAGVSINYRADVGPIATLGINCLVAAAAALNLALQLKQRRGSVPLWLPLLAGLYDAAAIVGSMGLADGFRSNNYIFLYPALLAFGLVFPGALSLGYLALTLVAYTAVTTTTHHSFRAGSAVDQKALAMRLVTFAVTVYLANIVNRVEAQRRARAVALEAERSARMLELERRARRAEQAAQTERARLSQEVHDGISQDAYMLSLGLETAVAAVEQGRPASELRERLAALHRLARQTLLESRNLLFDLAGVMAGEESLGELLRNQAVEFQAVTGIPVEVHVHGPEQRLPAATIAEIYRVAQEGLANVFRHACASTVTLEVAFDDCRVALGIRDDGRGFDPATLDGRGHGLGNMRARAERLGGSLRLTSQPGAGTSLCLALPLPATPATEDAHAADPHPAG